MEHITHNTKSNVPCSMFHVPWKKGFSLIELLVVMGMMTILLSIGGLSLANIRTGSQLDLVASEIRSELMRSQVRSSNGIPNGVYFESSRFVYFEGASYVEAAPSNEETAIPSALSLSSITFASNIARFNNVTRYLQTYISPSEVVVTDTQSGQARTISVNEWGMVEIN